MKNELISKQEQEVIKQGEVIKSLDSRYKRVIDELRKQLKWWQNNAWKATFIIIMNKLRRKEMK